MQTGWTSLRRQCQRQLHVPKIRSLSTLRPRKKGPSRAAFTLASLLFGIGGFYAGLRLSQVSVHPATPTKPAYGSKDDFSQAIKDLKAGFTSGDDVSTNPDDLAAHGISINTWHPGLPHNVVVYPHSTEDVVKIVEIANKFRMPVIPYSGGTSLEGHFLGGADGGICVDMSRMDKILVIHEADSDLICQPGVGWMEINETLKERGIPLFFPLDPGPTATIGGMLSTGCSGTNAVRYGTAKGEWFLNATVVLPSGEVIKTRRRSRKSSAGFDVTKLFIGAEGTLGIVTEVTIRLAPLLPTTVAIAQFPNVRNATEAVVEILTRGVGVQCIELTDAAFMQATNLYGASARKYDVADHLFFKLQGPSAASIKETARIVQEVVKKHGGSRWTLAKDAEEAETMWTDRKNAHYSGLAYGGDGAKGWATDVCVPISQLPELVYQTQQDLEQSGIKYTMVGHAGDGNFHTLMLFKTDEELVTVRRLVHRMVERAIALDGTCTGEHGVGVGKKEFLVEELGEGTVKLMKTIKRAIDPHGLFNPGKLYPDDAEPSHY
ncbi:FAD-binding domain-containing protein [Artomyces pyxidatus]|uniref:FAD-binding domain-containing protein n=1 Tax=Artomyces pyxidatus TaxID=48021 RepID=A0ACB8SZ27_9AGAM|nr:FAD-binding domain-containing protein [Artomyces pyxidatus]